MTATDCRIISRNFSEQEGYVVDMQGTRPIYEVIYNGTIKRVAITVSENGFVVGANPK